MEPEALSASGPSPRPEWVNFRDPDGASYASHARNTGFGSPSPGPEQEAGLLHVKSVSFPAYFSTRSLSEEV